MSDRVLTAEEVAGVLLVAERRLYSHPCIPPVQTITDRLLALRDSHEELRRRLDAEGEAHRRTLAANDDTRAALSAAEAQLADARKVVDELTAACVRKDDLLERCDFLLDSANVRAPDGFAKEVGRR